MTSREAHSHCISKICSVPKYFPQFSTKPLTLPLVLSKNFKNPLYLVPSFLVAAPMIRHRRGIFQAARSLLRGVSVTASTLSFLAKYSYGNYFFPKRTKLENYSKYMADLGSQLRNILIGYGPAFIKLGQLISTRVDMLPKEILCQLKSLQDQVPGMDPLLATKEIETQLGCPIDSVFQNFQSVPIAAASLGQVHLAEYHNQTVAIKIQRHNAKNIVLNDLKIIKVIFSLLSVLDQGQDGTARDYKKLYEEISQTLLQEIDYRTELQNANRLRRNFASVPWVKIPMIYENLSSSSLLTMEYVPGIKIDDYHGIKAANLDPILLSKRLTQAMLTQICQHGFFHCDPHPGNLACDGQLGGRIIFYDFGMMRELPSLFQTDLVGFLIGIYENDSESVCNFMEKLGVLRPGFDRTAIKQVVRVILNELAGNLNPLGNQNPLSFDEARSSISKKLSSIGFDYFSGGSSVPFAFPSTFVFLLKSILMIESIGRSLSPKYNIIDISRKFLTEMMLSPDGCMLLRTITKKASSDFSNILSQPQRIAKIEDFIERLESNAIQLQTRDVVLERMIRQLSNENRSLYLGMCSLLALQLLQSSKLTMISPSIQNFLQVVSVFASIRLFTQSNVFSWHRSM